MGIIKLEPRCPKSVNGLSFDPVPWSFKDILSELGSLVAKLDNSDPSFTKSPSREIRRVGRKEEPKNAFVMRVTECHFDDSDSDSDTHDSDTGDEVQVGSLVPGTRFTFNDIISESEDSEEENEVMQLQPLQKAVIHKMGESEFAFQELIREHEIAVQEEIRDRLTQLEAERAALKEMSISALAEVKRNSDAMREKESKIDMHHQRQIAEALDKYMTAIQRDHEHRSQIEERRIRNDAAVEEAKRREKALHEEKLRQQKAKAEEEAQREAAKREEERKATEEATRAKEVAEKLAKENAAAAAVTQNVPTTSSTADVPREVQLAGHLPRAAGNALKLEERRLQKYTELEEINQSILSGSNLNLSPKEREIARRIKQISGSVKSVRSKASELLKIFNDPSLPQSITISMFAKKVISVYETPNVNFNTSAFACGHVIVLVSAQVPAVMDPLLAEFHKACMYTVPKHVVYKKNVFQTQERYFKTIGFREEDGKLETIDQYLERLRSYMKLYGALVQTETQGVRNMHGLEEGWTWLAWFLNALPANIFTAVALEAFLRMAGFALYRKYKEQFKKILKAISREFVHKLKASGNPEINSVITRLEDYIDSNRFLEEPEGWRLRDSLLSSDANFESRSDGQYQQGQYREPQQYGRYY